MLDFIIDVLRHSANILVDSSLYLLFGFFVAGLIHVYFPQEKIARFFGGRNLRSVLNAGMLGVPLPLCSCSVIPTAVALRRGGASRGATMAFLISTPETGIDSIGVSFALLDPIMTLFRPLAALVTAVTAGLGANFLDRHNHSNALPNTVPTATEDCKADCCCDGESRSSRAEGRTLTSRLGRALKFSFGELLDDLAAWFLVGLILAALIEVLIPDSFFAGSLGHGLWPMLLMLVLGIPLYTCATASTPIAAALILKGLSPGAALVFLLAGPATNIGALLMLSRYFERRFLVLYLATISTVSLGMGGLLNLIYAGMHLEARAALGSGAAFLPSWLEVVGAVLLGFLLLRSLWKIKIGLKAWRYLRARALVLLSGLTK
jgi:uncharacterized protein